MYCRNCGEYIADDMMFCPRCGSQIRQPKKICYYCKNPLREGEKICPFCGKNQEVEMSQEDVYKGYWKKPVLWIVLVALFVSAIFISEYISNHPINISSTSSQNTVEITGEMTNEAIFANNQSSGYAVIDSDSIYCVKDNDIYASSLDHPEEMKKIIDGCQGYLSIDNSKLYYCDTYYDYYSYDLETKEKEKILENIYYPVIVNEKLYYQLDEDNESIHCLDFKTKEDKKYNDSTSYDISVDEKNEKIYYLNYVDNKYSLKRIDLSGENDESIYDCEGNVSFVLDDKNIYLYDDSKIIKINKENLEKTVLKDNLNGNYINICNDQLVCCSSSSVFIMSKDGKDEKEIYNGFIISMQVVGKNIILETYNMNYDKTLSVIDTKGNIMDLFEQSEIEEFEDIEEV